MPDNQVATTVKPPLIAGGKIAAIIPTDIDSCYRLAQLVSKAGMAPKSLDSVEKVTIAVMHGLEIGLSPMAALQSIAVINGQPAVFGDGLLAIVRGSGLLEDIIEEVEVDEKGEPTIATCKIKRRGEASWAISSFTRPEAQRAGLWNKAGPWQQYRSRMMRMRARSWALRDKFADVLRGLHSAEEMIDVSPRADSSPPPEPRRAQFVDIVEQGASDADQPDHDPETGEVAERPWAIPDSVVGLEARRKCLMDLLTMARVKVDVDEIQAEHQEFIDKLGRAKAEVLRALDNRRLELPERLEVEA